MRERTTTNACWASSSFHPADACVIPGESRFHMVAFREICLPFHQAGFSPVLWNLSALEIPPVCRYQALCLLQLRKLRGKSLGIGSRLGKQQQQQALDGRHREFTFHPCVARQASQRGACERGLLASGNSPADNMGRYSLSEREHMHTFGFSPSPKVH